MTTVSMAMFKETHAFFVFILVSSWTLSFSQQYYGSQAPPQVYPVQQQQNTAAWRQWYQQQQQQRQQQQQNAAAQAAYQRQLAAYNAARAAATRQVSPATAPQYNSYNRPAAPVASLQQYPASGYQQQPATQYTQQQYQQYYQQQARLQPAQTLTNPAYTQRTLQTAPPSSHLYANQPAASNNYPTSRGYTPPAVGGYTQASAVGQPPATGYQPPATSYQPPATGYQPPATGYHTPTSGAYHVPAATGSHSTGQQVPAASVYHPPATTPPPSTTPGTRLKLQPTSNLRKSLNGLANSLSSLRIQIKTTSRPMIQDALNKPLPSSGVQSASKTRMKHLLSAFKQVKEIVSVSQTQTGNLRSQPASGLNPSQVNPSPVNQHPANPTQFYSGLEPPNVYFQNSMQQSSGPLNYGYSNAIADSGWRPPPMSTPFPPLFASSSGALHITTQPSVTVTTEFLETEFPVTVTPVPIRQLANTTSRALDGGLPVMEFPQAPYDLSTYNVATLPRPTAGRHDMVANGLQGDPYKAELISTIKMLTNEIKTLSQGSEPTSGQNPSGSQYNQQSLPQQQTHYQSQPPQSSSYNSYYPPQQPQQQQYTSPTQPQQQQTYTGQPQPQQQQYTGQMQPQYTGQPQPQQQQYTGQAQTGQFQQPAPATENLDPFSTQFDVNGLKPTIFNPQYQPPAPQPSQQPQTQQSFGQSNPNEFAGILDQQGFGGQNPPAPGNKVDFSAKGPNPIQLNQFLAQPMAPKETNSLSTNLDTLLDTLLSSGASLGQQKQSKPKPTTKAPPPAASSLISDRLNDFILGPKSEFRSNAFSEIPTNGAAYDALNPLAGFMGETPPPPTTTTPAPPGRNGDFLAGFIGVNKELSQPKATAESFPPNIYMYDYQQSQPVTPAPAPQQTNTDLANLGTQDLSALVKKLLGVLAVKQAAAGQG